MKLTALLILLVLSLSAQGNTAYSASDKERMQTLLQERKDRFEKYTSSLNEKTGLFGGKTKKDLQASQKILVEIVRLDNQLISILNRQLDYKEFQKTEITYQSLDEINKADQLSVQLQVTKNELARITREQKELNHALHQRGLLLTFFAVVSVVSSLYALYFYRKSKKNRASEKTI